MFLDIIENKKRPPFAFMEGDWKVVILRFYSIWQIFSPIMNTKIFYKSLTLLKVS